MQNQSSFITTRCFCHFDSNFPQISIKTQKAANNWVVLDENTGNHETYKIFPRCGHAIHDRCNKVIARLNQEFQESVDCPMCSIDWTRPSEMEGLEQAERNNPNIKYNHCLCHERVRVYKKDNQWTPSLTSYKAYPCGHGCHVKCHTIFWKVQNKITNDCPLCAPALEERKITRLNEQVSELLAKVKQYQGQIKSAEDKRKTELAEWNNKRHYIFIAVLITSSCLIRFGNYATAITTPIPLTTYPLGNLVVFIVALALSTLTIKLLTMPK